MSLAPLRHPGLVPDYLLFAVKEKADAGSSPA
jgi:hypothetical protein